MELTRNFEEDKRPRVSVTILLYTGYGKYLHESLGSLARQTYRDFEVILVNDGSEDDTPQVAREMMERYRGEMRISLLDLPHQGIPASRNAGFNIARGDYYLNFDSDDMLSERFLEIGATYLDEHPETDVVYFPYQNFEGDTSFFMPPEFDPDMLKYWNFVLNQSLYRKKMFHILGGYLVGKTVYDDWYFWLRAARHGFSFKRLTGAYMLYRRHVASITARARSHGENAAPVWFANRESYDPYDLEWARKVLGEEQPRLAGVDEVLIIADAFFPEEGEGARFPARLSQELALRGFFVEVAVPFRFREYDYWNGAYLHELGGQVEGAIKLADYEEKLARLMSLSDYRAVLVCGRIGGWALRAAGSLSPQKAVFLPFLDGKQYRALSRNAVLKKEAETSLACAGKVLYMRGRPYAKEFLRESGVPFLPLPPGVDYVPAACDLRRRLMIPWTRTLILSFYEREEYERLADAVRAILSVPGDWALLVLGWGMDGKHREELVSLCGEEGRMLVLPWADEAVEKAALEAADLLLVYQDLERAYVRMAEAAAHRLPYLYAGPGAEDLPPGGVGVEWSASGDLSICAGEGSKAQGPHFLAPLWKILGKPGGRGVSCREIPSGEAARENGEGSPPHRAGKDGPLARALAALLDDAPRRQALGEEAYRHWRDRLTWEKATSGIMEACGLHPRSPVEISYRKNRTRPRPEFLHYLRSREKEPLVSVIIPTKDRPHMLGEAVRSVLDQTYENLEVIVVNDAGEDVARVLEGFRDSRITHHRNEENRGLAGARNVGLSLAHGDYICYLDDDDIFYPCHVEVLVDALEGEGAPAGYTDSHLAVMERKGRQWVRALKKVLFDFDFQRELLHANNFIHGVTFMHSRKLLEGTEGFDESLTVLEDWEFFLRLSSACDFLHVERITAEFRHRNDLSNMRSYRWDEFPAVVERIDRKHGGRVAEARKCLTAQLYRDGLPPLRGEDTEDIKRQLVEAWERRLVESYEAHLRDGDIYGRALSHLRRGMLGKPVNAPLYHYAARAAVEAGEFIMALDFLDGALFADPSYTPALQDLCIVERRVRGGLKWAETHMERLRGKAG
ncbi:MAG: glycosyltransferase [Actinobacteria bacterium]|nr:glycosyltransferase [Actinomycetota bacterium]